MARPGVDVPVARRVWRGLRWYLHGLTGESRYEAYLDHERRAHPDRTPLSRAEFWRGVHADQDRNPQGRCC
ncbi:YbdD/YjiX family protein [Desertihabitans aurantiacus]|uniref:YbdD/YjiX family protein n=1 Tax=Desertihabitans aurantiacus TaxID=2282477 RepID=UPI000DF84FBB|nr:YbdD/YjiX family protein [Desertihabitans aurantiacus]